MRRYSEGVEKGPTEVFFDGKGTLGSIRMKRTEEKNSDGTGGVVDDDEEGVQDREEEDNDETQEGEYEDASGGDGVVVGDGGAAAAAKEALLEEWKALPQETRDRYPEFIEKLDNNTLHHPSRRTG